MPISLWLDLCDICPEYENDMKQTIEYLSDNYKKKYITQELTKHIRTFSMSLSELQTIPGVGKRIAQYLLYIGIGSVSDLKGKNPERLYAQSNRYSGVMQDRCLLYVFRCAVYYAEHIKHDPEKLKWWNWKDK